MTNGIAIAGTITVDEIKQIDSFPNESKLTTINRYQRSIGGLVSNCSIALSKIDNTIPVEIITLIGEDEKGKYIKSCIKDYKNIDTFQLNTIGDTPFTDVMQHETNLTRTFFNYKGNSSFFNEETIDFTILKSKIIHIGYLFLPLC